MLLTADGYLAKGLSLHQAIRLDNVKEVARLLKTPQSLRQLEQKNKHGQTPLYYAARKGKVAIVRLLIRAGANVNSQEKGGWAPLHTAVSNKHLPVLTALLKAGANTEARNKKGQTPLYMAARKGRVAALKMLIKAGADINAQENGDWSALHSAVSNGHPQAVKALLLAGANIKIQNKKKLTAFDFARYRNRETMLVEFQRHSRIRAKAYQLTRSFELENQSSKSSIVVEFQALDFIDYVNVESHRSTFNFKTSRLIKEENGNNRVAFTLTLKPGQTIYLKMHFYPSLRFLSGHLHPNDPISTLPANLPRYLQADEKIEANHQLIQATSKKIVKDKGNDIEKIQSIIRFVRSHLKYKLQDSTSTIGALSALQTRQGDCTEYSVLAVALARAAGIPARVVGVQNMVNEAGSATYDNHNIAEFFINKHWVPADVNIGGFLGELPRHVLIMRFGLFTDKNTAWYRYKTLSGPRKKLKVKIKHHWRLTGN